MSVWKRFRPLCRHREFHSVRTWRAPASTQDGAEGSVYPDAPATSHHDLPSFLDHAERQNLNPRSTVYIGTHYEYLVSSTLAKYGFTLRRTGGRLDGGIDLIGTWTVPSAPQPLKVLIQCKAGTKLMPSLIRELGGSIQGAPVGWRGSQVLALLATMTPATAGVREALSRSEQPMGFILCSKTGVLQQFLWNGRAEAEGLHGIGVSLRRVPESQELTQLALTFHGKPLPSSSA